MKEGPASQLKESADAVESEETQALKVLMALPEQPTLLQVPALLHQRA